jgi:hypothetical protein
MLRDPPTWLACAGVAAVALVALLVAARLLGTQRIHVSGLNNVLNDQVGYIAVARHLVESGTLESNIIFPSTLSQNASRTYLHMPGHFFALAASYALFGFGVLPSLLPSAACYIVTAVLVFLIGGRLYDRRTGLLAAFVFVVLPANLLLALTAMAELTLVAAVTAAFAGFVFLPSPWRPWAGPLLLVGPFLFRETAALLVIPMAALILLEAGTLRVKVAIAFVTAAVATLTLVYRLDFSAGRPRLSPFEPNRQAVVAKYEDATLPPGPRTWQELSDAVSENLRLNLTRLLTLLKAPHGLEGMSLIMILLPAVAVLSYGLVVRTRDVLFLAAGLTAATTLALLLAFYASDGYRGVRSLLFTYPLLALCVGRLMRRVAHIAPPGGWWVVARAGGIVAALAVPALGLGAVARAGRLLAASDGRDQVLTRFVESLGHDDRRMLVAPYWIALPYVHAHHPVKWSFVPSNVATLELLDGRFDLGTLLVPSGWRGTRLRLADVTKLGFEFDRQVRHRRIDFLVFKRHAE